MEPQTVSTYARNSKLAAYQGVSVHGGIAGADPHRLVLMLMDGALERISIARGCIERGELARKASALHQCTSIVAELRGCLNMREGGELAKNLDGLYDYLSRRLLHANANNDAASAMEVAKLLSEIRDAWIAIGPEVRKAIQHGNPSAWTGGAASSAGPLAAGATTVR